MHPAIAALDAIPPLPPEIWTWLERASTATLTTQALQAGAPPDAPRRRRAGEPRRRMAGVALTLRYIPSREDLDVLDVFQNPEHPQRRAIELAGPGLTTARGDRARPRRDPSRRGSSASGAPPPGQPTPPSGQPGASERLEAFPCTPPVHRRP